METIIEAGGIAISVDIPEKFGESLFYPAYAPFIRPNGNRVSVQGMLRVRDIAPDCGNDMLGDVVSTGFNDLGESRLYYNGSEYAVGISPLPGMAMRYMRFASDFRSATLALLPGDSWNSFILDSMLRIFFSQIAVGCSSFLIHASAVEAPGGAHLFLGCSGTGKSTHSSLWLDNFSDCRLLNDDNPLVKLNPDGTFSVSGSPWSGKTRCWRDNEVALLSMTRLRQSSTNRYTHLRDVDAFVAVMPGVSALVHSRELYDSACTTLSRIVNIVKVGILDCRPDKEAAQLCRDNVAISKVEK